MKTYQGKTVEEALDLAASDIGITASELIYIVEDEKKGIFSKKAVINVYEIIDVIQYAEDYLLKVLSTLEIESTAKTKLDDDIIHITIDSTHNPILIGKNGRTLQSLNELVKLATSNHFHRRFRILLDVNGYKDNKYFRLSKSARHFAKEVCRTQETYTFPPMPADERRAIHNALSNFRGVRTESVGDGIKRQVQIIFVPGEYTPRPRREYHNDEVVESTSDVEETTNEITDEQE